MTVEIEVNKKLFDHNGVSPSVSFTFRVLQNSDLKYYKVDNTNPLATPQLQTEDVHYSLVLNDGGEGGVVTFIGTIPSSDFRGILITEYAFTQPSDLPTEGNFSEEAVEAALDRNTLLSIQLKEQNDRTIRFPLGDTATVAELPQAAARAGGLFAFDANGNVTTVQLTELEQLAVSAYFAQLASAADAPSALLILGIPYNPASAAGPASLRFYEDSDNGSNYLELIAPAALASSGNLLMPAGPSTIASLQLAEAFSNKTIIDSSNNVGISTIKTSGTLPDGVGGNVAPNSIGTVSTGTLTPAPQTHGPMPYYTNGGAHTLSPPANACTMLIEITNNGSAGAITTSSFTKVDGDAFTTTNGHKFLCSVIKTQNYSALSVKALQ